MKLKDKNSLIEEIQSAVANYCYDHDDQDFEITLSVRAEDGWVKVEDTEENEVSKEQAERYLHVLVEHNKWRRDDNVPNPLPMQDPKELGKALDFAVDFIKTFLEL